MKRKTKAQRQRWWRNLTSEQQGFYQDKWVEQKTVKRQKAMVKFMKINKLSFDCKKCIHGLTRSCTKTTKVGCTYFADEVNEVFGPAYAA